MKKITITIPDGKNKLFKMRYGSHGGTTRRKDAVLMYRRVEKKIVSLAGKEKTAVVIKDGAEQVINESISSRNPHCLLWIALAFLEDFLPKDYLQVKEKLYVGAEP